MEDFCRRIKLKANFKNHENKACFNGEDIFQESTNKAWVSNNNHHGIEINNEIEKTKQTNYSNLFAK